MSFVDRDLSGGFGNQLFQYAFARAYAEKFGAALRTSPWSGAMIFEIDDPVMENGRLVAREDLKLDQWAGETDIEITGMSQHGRHLIYTREQVRRWFRFRPELEEILQGIPVFDLAAHLRHADFVGHPGFISITRRSYEWACDKYCLDKRRLRFISFENPMTSPELGPSFDFLPDFVALMRARVLLRGPSTFSWWAGVLGDHDRIFSPDQRGIPYQGHHRGLQDVPFVEGNHMPITAWWEGHSELHLREQ